MSSQLSRREWLASALCLPPLSWKSVRSRAWDRPEPLGATGLEVTPLGMGCEEAAAREPALLRTAADLGVTHFNLFAPANDLTPLARAGAVLGPIRHCIVLAADLDGQLRARRRAAGHAPAVAAPGERTRRQVLADLDAQLRALRSDYVDLLYLTSKRRPEEISDELLEAVRIAKQAGKARAGAVSTHGFAAIVPRLLEVRETIGAVMVTCNFAAWDGISADVTRLRHAGVGIVAMKPLMGGLAFVPQNRRGWAAGLDTEEKRNAALAAALKWVLDNPLVDTSPVQMRSLTELERNVAAAGARFSAGDAEMLTAAAHSQRPVYCANCGACEGSCRHGLPVADMLRALMYAEGYRDTARGRAEFGEAGMGLQYVRCAECEACTVRCPNGVTVAANLARAQALLASSA